MSGYQCGFCPGLGVIPGPKDFADIRADIQRQGVLYERLQTVNFPFALPRTRSAGLYKLTSGSSFIPLNYRYLRTCCLLWITDMIMVWPDSSIQQVVSTPKSDTWKKKKTKNLLVFICSKDN